MDALPVNDVLDAPNEPAPVSMISTALSHSDFNNICAAFEQGRAFMQTQDYQQAIAAFDKGIQQMGYHYYSESLNDDTGVKLMLGEMEQKKGLLERAAHLKHNVLESRIHEYNNLHHPPVYIGSAWMEEEKRDIVLQLFTQGEGGPSGQALLRYTPDHPQYNEILRHLGGLEPGERKGVPPWP